MKKMEERKEGKKGKPGKKVANHRVSWTIYTLDRTFGTALEKYKKNNEMDRL